MSLYAKPKDEVLKVLETNEVSGLTNENAVELRAK